MIVQSRVCVGIHALSVCALKMTCEAPMTLLAASSMIFPAIFFSYQVVLLSARPSVIYEASVQVILSLWCIGWRQYPLLPDY